MSIASFRFVFVVASHARLMPRAADPPAAFKFEHSSTDSVLVRDVVDELDGVPRHKLLNVQVTCDGEVLDDKLFDHARALAETTLILLSAVSRAPTSDVEFFVAYEITASAEYRQFLQWLAVPELPEPRTPTPHALADAFWTGLMQAIETDTALAERLILSMSWYRRAVRETETLFRFSNLWLALEALNPRLADHFNIAKPDRKGLAGARRLLETVLGEDTTFKTLVASRNDLLHANRVLPEEVRVRVEPLMRKLDDALVAGWRELLGVPTNVVGPSSSVRPYPIRFLLRGLLQPDNEGWSENRHPWFEYTIKLSPREPDRPGQIKYDQTPEFTMRNAQKCTELHFEHRGPDVPNPVRIGDNEGESDD